MRQAVVHSGQSIFDIAIQHCGSVDASYAIAKLNNLTLDATLLPGQALLVPEVTDRRVVEELARRGVVPGTGWVEPPPEPDTDVYNLFLEIPYNVNQLIWFDNSYLLFSTWEGSLFKYDGDYTELIAGNQEISQLWSSGSRLFCSRHDKFYEIDTNTWGLSLLFTGGDNRFSCSFVNWQGQLLMSYMGGHRQVDNISVIQFNSGGSYSYYNQIDQKEDGDTLYITGATSIGYRTALGVSGTISTNIPWSVFNRHAWYTINQEFEYVIYAYRLYVKKGEGIWEEIPRPFNENILFIAVLDGVLHVVSEFRVYKLNGYTMYVDDINLGGGHGTGMNIRTKFFTMNGKIYLQRGAKILIHDSEI